MALKLEYIFGSSAQFWMNLEQRYQLAISKNAQKVLTMQEESVFKKIKPFLKIPEQLGLVSFAKKQLSEQIAELKRFLRRATLLDQSIQMQTDSVFRKSTIYDTKPE
jgi:hypothetical protein